MNSVITTTKSDMFNIIVLPISIDEGMAGSARLKNMFKYLHPGKHYFIKNIIFSNDLSYDDEGKTNENSLIYKIGYKSIKPLSILKFFRSGKKILKDTMKQGSLNILYVYGDINILIFPFIKFAKSNGYNIVVDVTEDNTLLKKGFNTIWGMIKYKTSAYFRKRSLKFIDVFITISKYLEEKLKKEVNCLIPIIHLPITIDPAEFNSLTWYKPGNILNVFYGGSFGEKDGLELLIRAAKELELNGLKIKLVLSGKGSKKAMKAFLKVVKKYEAKNIINYRGYVSREEYLNLLKHADIHCVTRLNTPFARAGFPFKLGEMLATGKPVILSRLKNLQELLSEDDVYFFEPENIGELKNAIIFLSKNSDQARLLGRNGRTRCMKLFSAKNFNFNMVLKSFNY